MAAWWLLLATICAFMCLFMCLFISYSLICWLQLLFISLSIYNLCLSFEGGNYSRLVSNTRKELAIHKIPAFHFWLFTIYFNGKNLVSYQLEVRKLLANVLTECFSRHQGESDEVWNYTTLDSHAILRIQFNGVQKADGKSGVARLQWCGGREGRAILTIFWPPMTYP